MTVLGFGKKDRKIMSGGDLEFYKGEKNRTDVISLCWFFEDEEGEVQIGEGHTPQFLATETHYIQGLGYIKDNDYLREKLGPPKSKIATFVVQYVTDRRGKLQKPLEFDVKPWRFSEDKYRRLAAIHEQFNLTMHDIQVTCEDDTYQKLNFTPMPKGAFWLMKDSIKQEVLQTVRDVKDRLESKMGREMSIEDLKDHYGEASGITANNSIGADDYDDLMEGIE